MVVLPYPGSLYKILAGAYHIASVSAQVWPDVEQRPPALRSRKDVAGSGTHCGSLSAFSTTCVYACGPVFQTSGIQPISFCLRTPRCNFSSSSYPQRCCKIIVSNLHLKYRGGREREKWRSQIEFSYVRVTCSNPVPDYSVYITKYFFFQFYKVIFLNLPNPSCRSRPWGLLSL
jgi:hypothetical protein